MEFKKLSTKEKALRINLAPDIYGSFAEIGAGQEVAANFFKAGGASGTIAKTMSAYDMAFSDAIYGPETSGRYVCEPRLKKMLNKEYSLLDKRLPHLSENTRFFGFANTVEAINYRRTNQGHGWLGVQFQLRPKGPVNECVIHVLLKDNDNLLQQEAIGVAGVNLIYGCFFHHDNPDQLLNVLLEELNIHRLEVDYFNITGPDFEHMDNRLMSLKLVKNGLTKATMFGPDGGVLQPADVLYKKNILVLRGRFRPVTHVNLDMLEKGLSKFRKEPDVEEDRIIEIAELTLSNLYASSDSEIDEKDFLDRVDILCSMGQTVMISNYQEFYRLIGYLRHFNRGRKIGVILGIYNLQSIFDEKYYEHLKGGILESFGVLFGGNTKLYVYPSLKKGQEELFEINQLDLPEKFKHIFKFFHENGYIEQLKGVKEEHLHIISDDVIKMIKEGASGWEEMVPAPVARQVKEKCLFDYPCEI